MKKSIVLCAGICVTMLFSSCWHTKESAYKKAYEHAKATEAAAVIQTEEPVVAAPVVTPVVTAPATQAAPATDNVSVRTESLSVIDGAALKNYSVVVGSFGLKANAERLCQSLRSAGYEARIAYNADRNMYRVVATSYNDKASAVSSRDQLRGQYPDAWLLFQK